MPLHPLIVHFPVVLSFVGAVFLVFWLRSGDEKVGLWTLFVFVAALLSSGAAAISGQFAADAATIEGDALALFERHENLAYGILVLHFAMVVWLSKCRLAPSTLDKSGLAAIALLLLLCVAIAAHSGGELVYVYGVGVMK